ncbi:MAG: EamA family transporter [Nitriliruptorales bacterium]|nr:EamA family transporter [Nitriliruptorales bacterium]
MAVALGLASAIVYGAADFLGGLASKRSGAYAVVVWSQMAGLVVLAAAVVVTDDPLPAAADLWWGAVGGVGGGGGVVLLYRGLSIGRMSVVAPTAAVGAASLPVLVGIALREQPPVTALAGIVIALAAIVLVSSSSVVEEEHRTHRIPPGSLEGAGAGAGFALFFICLAFADADGGLWPLLTARVSIVVAAAAAVATRTTLRPVMRDLGRIVVVGIADMLANLLYLLATRRGLLSIVAVLVSLYPASTVVLARFVLHERLSGLQLTGLTAAAIGVALIAAG